MQESFIDNPAALAAFIERIQDSAWLAIDTEFLREKTYFPKLCLLQIANEHEAACIDPLAIDDLSPLFSLLQSPAITKVFHAGRQDLEIFLHDWELLPAPLFDTQPAAALLGHGDQIGYAKLVHEVLGIDLPKDHSRTDWSRRPLEPGQLRYALDDVIYLGQAYERLRAELSKLGRLDWLEPEFSELLDTHTYVPHPDSLWKKVKGRQQLRGVRLAVLQRLAAWREEQATRRDLPRKWVLKDEVAVEIARRMPESAEQLERIRGVEGSLLKHHAETLLELVRQGRAAPKEQWPQEKIPSGRLTAEQDAMADMLTAALKLIAADQQLTPTAVASRKDIEKLVLGDDSSLLHGWRKRVAGETLSELLAGQRQLVCHDGGLSLSG